MTKQELIAKFSTGFHTGEVQGLVQDPKMSLLGIGHKCVVRVNCWDMAAT